jgi:hypothetical protein
LRLVNLNIPAPKTGDFQMCPKRWNDDFLENGSENFDWISVSYRLSSKIKRYRWIFRKITVRALETQRSNVNFVGTDSTAIRRILLLLGIK